MQYNQNSNTCPTDLPDYKDDAIAYELEQRARPDEMAMLTGAGEVAKQELDTRTNASVLDLCCGTGMSLEHIVDHANVDHICGVDISREYIDFARENFRNAQNSPHYIIGDAVTVPIPVRDWDVIMLASAYHHIEDERKLKFLHRAHNLLGKNGVAIFAENILPHYSIGNNKDYCDAVRWFYSEVIKTAEEKNPTLPEHVKLLIERVAKYGVDGEYEYKTSYPIFKQHLKEARLEVIQEERVWPTSGPLFSTTAGNYVVKVRAI